jgi:hypothetical protein
MVIAIKIEYISPRTGERNVSSEVLTGYDPAKHSISKIIETAQKKIKEGHVLDKLPSITYQVCDNLVAGMVASTKL